MSDYRLRLRLFLEALPHLWKKTTDLGTRANAARRGRVVDVDLVIMEDE